MKVREAREASLPAPPEALLWFGDRTCSGPGPGMDAYPGRDAWLAARRDWEARHGMTIAEWSGATLAELQRRAGSLTELSEALELTMFEEDDWEDPRSRPPQHLTPEQQLAARAAMRAKMEEA